MFTTAFILCIALILLCFFIQLSLLLGLYNFQIINSLCLSIPKTFHCNILLSDTDNKQA